MVKKWFIFMFMVLAGCGQQETLPTLMPTPEQLVQPSNTPVVTATLEPTADTGPLRPTFPPTWTPSPMPDGSSELSSSGNAVSTSDAAGGTLSPTVQVATAAPLPTLAVCAAFRDERERNPVTFLRGETPQVYWTIVGTAVNYRVSLIDDTGQEVFSDYTADATYTFRADLFEKNRRYGWEVYPRDAVGQQMCLARGAELIPQ